MTFVVLFTILHHNTKFYVKLVGPELTGIKPFANDMSKQQNSPLARKELLMIEIHTFVYG